MHSVPAAAKKKPPFAKMLTSQCRDVFIFFGHQRGWSLAKAYHKVGKEALCLPVDEAFEDFDWSCLECRSVVAVELVECGAETRRKIAQVLDAAGAARVFVFPFTQLPKDGFYVKGQNDD